MLADHWRRHHELRRSEAAPSSRIQSTRPVVGSTRPAGRLSLSFRIRCHTTKQGLTRCQGVTTKIKGSEFKSKALTFFYFKYHNWTIIKYLDHFSFALSDDSEGTALGVVDHREGECDTGRRGLGAVRDGGHPHGRLIQQTVPREQ